MKIGISIPTEDKYLFNWDEVPGNDTKKLIKFLKQNYNVKYYTATSEINKIDFGKTITFDNNKHSVRLKLNDKNTEIVINIDNIIKNRLTVKCENGHINIYEKIIKIRLISSKEDINSLEPSEVIIHLAFRPSNTDIFKLVEKCPNLKAIQIPASFKITLSKFTKNFLVSKGIELLDGDLWGHRKDIDEYFEVKLDRMKELKKTLPRPKIVNKLQDETRLCPDLLRFIVLNISNKS